MDGILVGPGEGEKVSRGPRDHRILAELPELEVVELRFGPDFEGVGPHSHADQVDSEGLRHPGAAVRSRAPAERDHDLGGTGVERA